MFTCGWVLLLLWLQSACATGHPMERAGAETRRIVSLSTRAAAVRVSNIEFNQALTALVLELPLRVADAHFALHAQRRLAQASFVLTARLGARPWHDALHDAVVDDAEPHAHRLAEWMTPRTA